MNKLGSLQVKEQQKKRKTQKIQYGTEVYTSQCRQDTEIRQVNKETN